LRQIVGDNEIRAVGRHLNPETLHFVVFGKAFNFKSLALLKFSYTPVQGIYSLIGLLSIRFG
jgi:hypothetical protein